MKGGSMFYEASIRGIANCVLLIADIFLYGFAVMFLWNGILPNALGVGSLTYLQAVGLILMVRLISGNADRLK